MTSITEEDRPVIRISDPGSGQDILDPSAGTDGTVVEVGSTGISALEPLVMLTDGGRTAFYTQCSPERASDVASRVGETDEFAVGEPDAVVDHDPDTTRLPVARVAGAGGGVRDVLGGCGWHRPTAPADHEAAGGFTNADSEDVLRLAAELRGRGWGDLCHDDSLAETWESVRDGEGDKVVVVNAHGNAADTLLLDSSPFEVLDGAVTVADTVGAARIVVYVSTDDEGVVETVREAIENYPSLPVDVGVVTGPAEYRAAEPSMAIEAIEGNHRLEARIRPPDLDEVGLHGQPTLVHTPRTFAQLSAALRAGATRDTRLVTVAGDVAHHATIEVPQSETLETLVDAVDVTGEFKAAYVGGQFGGLTADLDVGVGGESLSEADLGTDGEITVLTADRCVVEFVGQRTTFAAEENCGRCVPCREGTTQLAALLREVYDGTYDPDGIEELVDVMSTSSICAFGVQAGRPARTALAEFESEFEAHAEGQCPAGSCLETLEA